MSVAERRALWLEVAIVLVVIWLPLFMSGWLGRGTPGEWNSALYIMSIGQFGGASALILYLLERNGESWRHVGLRRCRWWKEILWAALIYIAAWMTYYAVWRWEVLVFGDVPKTQVFQDKNVSGWLVGSTFLVGAFFEELFIRGYLWDRLRRLTGSKAFALLASSALFTIYHPYAPRHLIGIFAFGLVFGLFFWWQRSLPRLVLAHALFNLSIYSMGG